MAWTTPMTAVAGNTLTAADWNTHVRDNLLETSPAKATTAGSLFVGNGANTIVERIPTNAEVSTSETTSTTSYTNLATVGPTVTVATGTKAMVWFNAWMGSDTLNIQSFVSVDVTGSTSIAASDNWAMILDGVAANNFCQFSRCHMFTTLTPGSNTFTMKYKAGAGISTFQRRELIVLPL